jgi:hypothetical protein
MSHPLSLMIEHMLRQKESEGEFDNLPGSGRPIEGLSDRATSVHDRVLREAGAKPVPVLLNIEIAAIRDRLAAARDPQERKALMKELADKQTRLAIEIEAYSKYD